jgi:hypothetical protein
VHEGFRERKAERQEAAAEREWRTNHDSYVELIDTARTFRGLAPVDGLLLGPGETVFLDVGGCALVEERRGQGTYVGHSQGFSVPVARVGGRQIRYRVGATKGHYVQGTPTPTSIDTGTAVITSSRVIFQGSRQTRECPFAKLIGYQHDADGSTTFSLSNRAKPVTVHYGTEVAPTFDFRLELALAHFRNTVDDLVAALEADLAAIDSDRPEPVAPTVPAEVPEPDAPSTPPDAPTTPPAVPPPSPPAAPPPAPPPTPPTVPPGWYPDPWGAAPLRWWDGRAWSWQTTAPGPPPTG